MSGGHFDYQQYVINEVADEIERFIQREKTPPNPKGAKGFVYGFGPDTIKAMERGVLFLRTAYIYAQRIDWLLSGDDGEENFRERLKQDLSKIMDNPSDVLTQG